MDCTYSISRVPVTINGGPSAPEVKSLPKHKKNTEIGEKKTIYSSAILLEQEDGASFDDNEEVSNMLYVQTTRLKAP